MGRRKKMENIENNQNSNENIIEKIDSSEETLTTTVSSTTTLRPKVLYQIFFGDSADELYTWNTPIIDLNQVYLSGLIKKATLSEDLYDKVVEIDYRQEMDEESSCITKNLDVGIAIKVINHFGLDWLDKSFQQAELEFKEESLNAYRSLLPKLFSKLENLEKRRGNDGNKLMDI